MMDLIFLAIAITFFVVAVAYVGGCEKLRGESHD
jgi:nitrate reductase NapE component